eukprot:724434-Prymnesium_polylepis.2
MAVHASTEPMSPNGLRLTHLNPYSTRQSASQPSPAIVLLSSHASAVVRIPSPQICTACENCSACTSDELATVPVSTTTVSSSNGDAPLVTVETPVEKVTPLCSLRRTPPSTSSEESSASVDAFNCSFGCGPTCEGDPSA